jgi:hypothetical protein
VQRRFGLTVLITALAGVAAVRRLQIPLQTIEPRPWSLGIRFTREPEGLHRFIVAPGAAADATPVSDLHGAEDAWISLLVRNGRLVPVRSDTILRAGDEAVVLSSGPDVAGLSALFTAPAPNAPQPGAWRGTALGRDHGNIRVRQAGLDGGEGWKAVGGHGGDGAGGGG